MGLYEGIKDIAKIIQKADNVELYRQVLDLEAQALEMQAEIAALKEENAALKKGKDLSDKIVRYPQPYITLKDDDQNLKYCAHCWDSDKKLIQLMCGDEFFRCPHCKMGDHFIRQGVENVF